jgi:hypothetical protein
MVVVTACLCRQLGQEVLHCNASPFAAPRLRPHSRSLLRRGNPSKPSKHGLQLGSVVLITKRRQRLWGRRCCRHLLCRLPNVVRQHVERPLVVVGAEAGLLCLADAGLRLRPQRQRRLRERTGGLRVGRELPVAKRGGRHCVSPRRGIRSVVRKTLLRSAARSVLLPLLLRSRWWAVAALTHHLLLGSGREISRELRLLAVSIHRRVRGACESPSIATVGSVRRPAVVKSAPGMRCGLASKPRRRAKRSAVRIKCSRRAAELRKWHRACGRRRRQRRAPSMSVRIHFY